MTPTTPTHERKPELLPCPFCGSTASVFMKGQRDSLYTWMAECDVCACASPEHISSDSEGARDNAVKSWNTRPLPSLPPEQGEKAQSIPVEGKEPRDTLRERADTYFKTAFERQERIAELDAELATLRAAHEQALKALERIADHLTRRNDPMAASYCGELARNAVAASLPNAEEGK